MSYNPYARYRYGGELYHGRTKGSKNGVSNTPGYKAVGKKATGRIIGYRNGTPIYEYTDAGSGYADPRSTAGKQRTLLGRVGLLAGRVGSTVSRAAGNVGRTVSGAANQAVKTVKKTARNAYNAVGNAWDGKAGKGTAKDLARLSRNPERENARYNRSIRGRLESAGRAISSAGRSAGNWLTGRANDVGKAARGAAKNAYNAIGKAWDGKAGKGSAKDDAAAYTRYADQFGPKQAESRKLGTRLAYLRAARGANYDYDNSIKGRLESAGRAVSKAANSAGNWLNDRRRDVGNAVNNIRDEVEYAWDGKIGKGTARDYAARNDDGTPGRSYAYDNSIRGRLEKAGKAVSKAARGASKYVSDRANDVGKAARGAARNAAGAVGGAANRVRRAAEEAWDGKAGKGTARDMAENFNGPAKNEYNRKYDRSIKGTAERVGKAIGGAAGKARDTVGGTAKSVSEKASNRMKEASDFISTTAKNASSTIDKATKPVRDNVSKAVSNKDEYNRMVMLGSYYDADTNQWASPEAKQNYESAKRSYEQHLLTQAGKLGKEAKQTVNKMLKDAKTTGSNAVGKVASAYSDIESYIKRLSKGKK